MSTQREIKFRALYHSIMPDGPQVTPKWAYGNLSYAGDKVVQIFDQQETGSVFNCYPGTQGQYTGLKDKNRKEIYEGDILLVPHDENPEAGSPTQLVRVAYDGPWLMYITLDHGTHWSVADIIGYRTDMDTDAEVIGNIHENPELIAR